MRENPEDEMESCKKQRGVDEKEPTEAVIQVTKCTLSQLFS